MSTKIKLASLIMMAGVVLVVAFARGRAESANDTFSFDAANLKDRTAWTQVNDKPYYISSRLNLLCQLPTANDYERERKTNPHVSTFITVYVNNIGLKAMFARNPQRFPEGSIIVKEKIHDYEAHKPVLYTIMRKRERGYNPEVGDWEFSVVGPNGTELQGRGKLENCQSCHISERDSDFVFRPYLNSN
ncbi:MAG TPA: cytochrome P460 family protein [Pyrinomonadaceae bacterium]|jgi:hypothetical protein|nr:cytochrome P460 family protein [Pyrinomonadaceae bacterium]